MILVNGIQQEMISVFDRGLSYGDGLFETIAVVNGEPLLWPLHMQRLESGCRRLGIVFPGEEVFTTDLAQLPGSVIAAEKYVVKIILTRGAGERGYLFAPDATPNRIVIQSGWPGFPDSPAASGVKVRICGLRLARQPELAGLKHLNRLEQVVARSEWNDAGIAEGLMLDQDGRLIEATMSNVFVVDDGELLTPKLDQCGVKGVQRENIIGMAEDLGIAFRECIIEPSILKRVTEIFLTNSIIGVWPVTLVDNNSYAIGPVTRSIQQLLAQPA